MSCGMTGPGAPPNVGNGINFSKPVSHFPLVMGYDRARPTPKRPKGVGFESGEEVGTSRYSCDSGSLFASGIFGSFGPLASPGTVVEVSRAPSLALSGVDFPGDDGPKETLTTKLLGSSLVHVRF